MPIVPPLADVAGLPSIGFVIISFFILFPFLWMISVSFRSKADVFDPGNFFASFTLGNYRTIFASGIGRLFKNSAIIAVSSTFVSLVLGSLAAYGFAAFGGKRQDAARDRRRK